MLLPLHLYIISIPLYVIFLMLQLRQKISLSQIVFRSLFYFYIIGVISVTLLPLPINPVFRENLYSLPNNFVPFKNIFKITFQYLSVNPLVPLKQIGGNILLGMPLGFLLPFIWEKQRSFIKILKWGLLFSLGIETSQFMISLLLGYNYRIADIDDVFLNTLGSVLGYFLFKLVKEILLKKKVD